MQQYNLLLRLDPRQVIMPACLARVEQADLLHQQREVRQLVPDSSSALNRMRTCDWRYTLAEADLPEVRGSPPRAGVEVPYRFRDTATLDFSLTPPNDYMLERPTRRRFFKVHCGAFFPTRS